MISSMLQKYFCNIGMSSERGTEQSILTLFLIHLINGADVFRINRVQNWLHNAYTIRVRLLVAASLNEVLPIVAGVLISLSSQQPSTNLPLKVELSLRKGLAQSQGQEKENRCSAFKILLLTEPSGRTAIIINVIDGT